MTNFMISGRLEKWVKINLGYDGVHKVFGAIYDSPKFEDGEEVTTSIVLSHETEDDKKFVITQSGSKYLLGAPGFAADLN